MRIAVLEACAEMTWEGARSYAEACVAKTTDAAVKQRAEWCLQALDD